MSNEQRKVPRWDLGNGWAVDVSAYQWVVYRLRDSKPGKSDRWDSVSYHATKPGKSDRWDSVSYHATPEQLLESLYRKILRTNPPQPDLQQHIEACLSVAEACSERFVTQIGVLLGSAAKVTPSQASTLLKKAG
jgi:hypothetical protein